MAGENSEFPAGSQPYFLGTNIRSLEFIHFAKQLEPAQIAKASIHEEIRLTKKTIAAID